MGRGCIDLGLGVSGGELRGCSRPGGWGIGSRGSDIGVVAGPSSTGGSGGSILRKVNELETMSQGFK